MGTSAVDGSTDAKITRVFENRAVGAQDLVTPGGTFHTILLEENYRNLPGSNTDPTLQFTFLRWVDRDSGTLLQVRSYKWDGTYTQWTTMKLEHVT